MPSLELVGSNSHQGAASVEDIQTFICCVLALILLTVLRRQNGLILHDALTKFVQVCILISHAHTLTHTPLFSLVQNFL